MTTAAIKAVVPGEVCHSIKRFASKAADVARLKSHFLRYCQNVVEMTGPAGVASFIENAAIYEATFPAETKTIVEAGRSIALLEDTAGKVQIKHTLVVCQDVAEVLEKVHDGLKSCPRLLTGLPSRTAQYDAVVAACLQSYKLQESKIEKAKTVAKKALEKFGSATDAAESWDFTKAKYLLSEATADPTTIALAKAVQNAVSQEPQ